MLSWLQGRGWGCGAEGLAKAQAEVQGSQGGQGHPVPPSPRLSGFRDQAPSLAAMPGSLPRLVPLSPTVCIAGLRCPCCVY